MASYGSSSANVDGSSTVNELKAEVADLATTIKKLATEQAGTVADAVKDQAGVKINDLEAYIRRDPVQSAVIAAGIGFVVGMILRR